MSVAVSSSAGTVQSSDPAAAAYSKAILIGDFCTAQQLSRGSTPAQQASAPTSANMTGTALQRAGKELFFLPPRLTLIFCHLLADYSDPAYLSNRTIDPSTLPVPSKRLGPGGSTPGALRSSIGHESSQGHMRSPSASGSSSYHHQPPPPPLPSRHHLMPSQPPSGVS